MSHERVVRDPVGREWAVRLRRYRWPGPPPPHDEETWLDRFRVAPLWGPIAVAVASLARYTVVPVVQATLGRRPWIVAETDDERLVWRATGRFDPDEALAEIAAGLARGEARPAPLEAHWVGDGRAPRLPPKRR